MQDFNPQNLRYAKLVDQYSRYIKSPVLRLKFLQNALKNEPPPRRVRRLPVVGSLPERMMVVIELSKVMPLDQRAPLGIRLTALMYRFRHLVYSLCIALAISAGAGLVYVGSKLVSTFSIEARDLSRPNDLAASSSNSGDAVKKIGSEAGLTLDKVWLAEQGEGYEFYSNGARVLTEYQTDGPKRVYYRFDLAALSTAAQKAEQATTPVGIVYHLSEGDQLPFDDSYNSSLQNHSKALLEYARAHHLYNYVIDRFGRTYRITSDETMASHAGNSVWSDGKSLFINLSPSFIGICLEGQSAGGTELGADGINEAQIYAARALTAVLRSKYGISDANCVTHGLVSVNPSNGLMGYHTDWVASFPFEALGLSNKYETEILAISRLGFGYDRAYLAKNGGKKWPGLERADSSLQQKARSEGESVEDQRHQLLKAYQALYIKQRELEQQKSKAGN
jgi:N-acetylmuramoyl-L-alanine amidase-like protein